MLDWLLNYTEIFWWKILTLLLYLLFTVAFLYGLWAFKKQDARLYPKDGKKISKNKTRRLLKTVGIKMRESPRQPHPDGKLLSREENRKFLKKIGLPGNGQR